VGLSRRTLIRAASLALPLLVVLVGFKVLEVSSAVPIRAVARREHNAWLYALLLTGGAAVLLLRRWGSSGRKIRIPIALLFTVLAIGAVAALQFYSTQPLLAVGMIFELLRDNTVLAALFFLSCCVSLERLHGAVRTFVLVTLYTLALVLMLIAGFDLGYYWSTGSAGGWPVLIYGVTHLRDVFWIVLSEIDRVNALLLGIPVAAVALAGLIPRFAPVRQWVAADTTPYARTWIWAVAVAALGLVIAPRLPIPPWYARHSRSIFVDGVRDVRLMLASDATATLPPDDGVPLFDSRTVRFVPTSRRRPLNVVLIVLESTGARATTVYNPTLPTTPFLAQLARRARVVDTFYAIIPHTSKALVAILCGIPPKIGFEIVEGRVGGIAGRCLPALLEEHGYASAVFTTEPLTFESNGEIFANTGFTVIRGEDDFRDGGFASWGYVGLDDRAMLQPSLEWIDRVRQEARPFFLTYLTVGGHHPYRVPESYPLRRYASARNPTQERYFNALRYRDDFLRDLFQGFEERGLLDSTFVIVLGDHGEAFGEHGRYLHSDVPWDEVLRIPGLVLGPGNAGTADRIDGLRQQIDVLPTVASALGFEITGGALPGYDLLGPIPDDRRLYFSSWFVDWLAYREGPLKRIYHYDRLPMEAYDLVLDPLESHNINDADASATAEIELRRWAATVNRGHHR